MCPACEMIRVYRESKIQDGAPLLFPPTSVYRQQQQQQTVMVQFQTPLMQQQQQQMQYAPQQMQYAPQAPVYNSYQPQQMQTPQQGEGNSTNM